MSLMRFKQIIDQKRLYFLLVTASAVLLIVGSLRFLYELMLVSGNLVLEDIRSGKAVSRDELALLEQSRLKALNFAKSSAAYDDLGASYYARVRDAATIGEQRIYALKAIEASMESLKLAPLNTFAWFRVATSNVLLGPEHYEMAIEAWRKSISTANYEPTLLKQRVHLGVILYQNMTTDDIELLKNQLVLAYRTNREELREYGRRHNLTAWFTFLSESGSRMAIFLSK
ncbi:hypothetical protein [Kordiimonas gwangyangensis]|uniref:hypothetical protein n=1 Tax=Kordiimonas gwangyangensis TaxID=288022 RepID=UPI000365FBF9|nr:hypothetical protein [Kordiimonas gwangyangensis]